MKVEFANKIPSITELATLCGGRIGGSFEGSVLSTPVASVCTDSREAGGGGAFIAICGEKVDGHKFVSTAAAHGSVCAICTRIPDDVYDFPIIIVDDMLTALSRLGREYSKTTRAVRIGVTGSVGKTTTKEFIASVLGTSGKVWRTQGNYNSVIGLPLSLLTIPDDADYAVIEMGMNKPGETEMLSRTACPDYAVITRIGTSHIEYLGSRENIAKEKLDITKGLSDDGYLFLCGNEPLLSKVFKTRKNVRYFSPDDKASDYYALNIRTDNAGITFDAFCRGKMIYDLEIPCVGKHNVAAALVAVGIATTLGLDEDAIRRGLASYRSVGLRQLMLEIGGRHIICDCYNASPESMKASSTVLDEVSRMRGGRKIAVLGDMLELGESSESLHYGVGEAFGKIGVDALLAFGSRAEAIGRGAKAYIGDDKVEYFADISNPRAVAERLCEISVEGDTILFKASRMIAAERIVEELRLLFND